MTYADRMREARESLEKAKDSLRTEEQFKQAVVILAVFAKDLGAEVIAALVRSELESLTKEHRS